MLTSPQRTLSDLLVPQAEEPCLARLIHLQRTQSPPTDSHAGDAHSRSESPIPTDTSPMDRPMVIAQPRVKLPKLTIKKFNGDLTKWVTFWDSFKSAIHSNPTLSSVDKFSYLHSLLDSTTSDVIGALTLTSANYEEAMATLRRRFGNEQVIVSKYMNALLILQTVSSHHDFIISMTVKSHMRGLRALRVDAGSYGQLLSSILMNKLLTEMHLIISHEPSSGKWNVEEMMGVINHEIEAREQSTTTSHVQKHPVKGLHPHYQHFLIILSSQVIVFTVERHIYQAHAPW